MSQELAPVETTTTVTTTPPVTPPVVDPPVTPPVTDPPVTPPAVTTPAEPDTFDRAYVESLRRESAANRVKANELQASLDAIERDKMTELEKVKADLLKRDTDISASQTQIRQLQVQLAASKVGIVDPEAASVFIDWDAISKGATVEQELEALLVRKPYLKAATVAVPTTTTAPTTPTTPTTPPTAPGTPTTPGPKSFTKTQLLGMKNMSEADMADVQAALADGRVDYSR